MTEGIQEDMKTELISVIIPVYKVEKYINRCVESVLVQNYHNIEVILVDDGSPDNCGIICDKYAEKDSRIKVIHKKMVDYLTREMQDWILQQDNIYVL